ncbi:molybdopterin biosynthesis protein [Haematobacter massiliensis]|uniref:Molybdopterin-synthase adenylyltransferase n=1 Tax=Haematobacter massiliensis TaxID=195105 RepID=A0A086XZ91_9RHOB|nr:molybdopterin-synthase adenylyltransferase MoeB [Haematobacter massiliensis]KFI27341.1 molybdopterin biosynthesis protein [Haematobacter massiliensis]OWJ70758.1 molybdopterin biosynthesis protein [Haematobacter massiliensis]OWJ84820.1 molybdopterin biosynthesis protein [Haematobacter massiliensis]QBJ23786.1 molybdopterin-synthase adenylyltransferase MoeB [Haematobacter massiliensis]
MLFVLLLAAAVWGLAAAFGIRREIRWLVIGLLYVAILAMLVVLPEGAALRGWLGWSVGAWLVFGGAGLAVWSYAQMLGRLRRRAGSAAEARSEATAPTAGGVGASPRTAALSDAEVERYSRHLILREIGGQGQRRLRNAHVLVVGAGGIGSPALLYLAGAGVGRITLVDDDSVDLSNLQRQVIHRTEDIGRSKVSSAARGIHALNPGVTVVPVERRLDAELAAELIPGVDLVLDGSDGFATRALVNNASVAARVPLLSASVGQWEGQISLFDPARGAPCLACLFPVEPAAGLAPTCAEGGVAGPLPGVLGTMMALETLKELTGAGTGLRGRLLLYDGLYGETRMITVLRRPGCPVCGDI